MEKKPKLKTAQKITEGKRPPTTGEESSGTNQKREEELASRDNIAKVFQNRDLELTKIEEERKRERAEWDRIAKMLVRRDLALSEMREKREKELEELKIKTKELEESKAALMNMLEDIEEARARAEEEKNKTLSIITNLSDGLLVFDRENKLSLMNPQAEIFFNVKNEEVVGKSVSELSGCEALASVITLAESGTKGIFRREVVVRENLILEVSSVPITRGKEQFGSLFILHDVTREKMVERMKTEFVSLAAHQLRTPLSAIKWTLRILLDGDLGEINQEQRSFLEKTYVSNERMIALINDLLNLTRIEEGRYLYKPILTDLGAILQLMVNSYKEEAERKRIALEFQKPEKKLPQVLIDVEKIKLTLQNLIENAIRYTLKGGKVTVSLNYGKNEVEVAIQDTGVGIPKDQRNRVFDKFFRAANVVRMETEGTGLGLFIAKNIIESHGGRIWFESEEKRGTTFHFTLPAKEEFAEFLKEL